jgi:hypothetical protein
MQVLEFGGDGSCTVGYPKQPGSRRQDANICFKPCRGAATPVAKEAASPPSSAERGSSSSSSNNSSSSSSQSSGGGGGGGAPATGSRTSASTRATTTFNSAGRAGIAVIAATKKERFWKVGIAVPDVDAAVAHVRQCGAECTDGAQFKDIGYVAHTRDPEGFTIELLQFTFGTRTATTRGTSPGAPPKPFKDACVGQVTLRAHNRAAMLECWVERLQLRLVSVQAVSDCNFELYFFAGPCRLADGDDV